MNYQIDGQPASDTAFYAVACDPAQSVVVEACAGAGKTWMLVSRIVRALLAGTAPNQILAITFTRKAAGEMQQRLHQWLRSWAAADHAHRVQELRLRGLDAAAAEAAAPRLAQLWGELLASGSGVQVRTFHAWFGQLLRMAPLAVLEELGLHPGMALIEDTRELHAPLMQRFARAVLADAQASADHLALGQRVGRDTLGKWLEQAWGRRIEIERATAAGTLEGAVPPAATAWAHPLEGWPHLLPLLAEVAAALGAAKGKKSQDAAAALVAALALPDAQAAYAAAREALFTAKGPRKLTQEPAPEFLAGCDALDALAAALAQQDAHDDHRRMVSLTRLLLAEYRALKRERSLVDMNDLETLAVTLLADSQWAPWLHERLDVRFRHVLLDEFQDTSPLQWQALAPWLAGYAGAGGGAPFSVFIVGDPKQSIYRFRRAEPRVFAAAQDFVATLLGGRRLAANHTRRNTQGVLDTVNAVFGQAQATGQYPGFVPHTSGATEAPALQGIYHLPLVPRPEREAADEAAADAWRDSLTTPRREVSEPLLAEEARRIAAAVAALVRPADARPPVPPGAIYVLARRRLALAEVGRALRALHVPHVQASDLTLTDVAEVRDVLALLDVLASPGHDAALAQVLKSPLFGASDADLMALAARRAPTWLAALAGQTSPPLARAAELLPRWAALARRWPPHDVLDHLLHEGDGLPRLLAACDPAERAQAQAALTALIEETLALDGGRYLTLYAFVRALKKRLHKLPAVPTPGAVQLLTVHSAKGLEADVVFLADTHPNARGGAQPELLVDWPVTHAHPVRAAFVAGPKATPPSLQALAEDEASHAAREQLNLLYVALTRARGALVVSAVQPHRRASPDASWWERLTPLTQPWPEAWQAAPADAAPDAPAELPDWRALAAPPAQPLDAAPTSAIGRTGEAFHRLLQWGRADDAAAAQAANDFELDPAAATQAQAAAARVLASPTLAVLEQGADWRADEVPIVWQGQSLRIDRLLKRGDTWWVLDHKLHHSPQHDPALRAQLATYAEALAALEPGSPIRTAFVTGAGEVVEVGG